MAKSVFAFEAVTAEAEALINHGSAAKAAESLRKVPLKRIPRRFLARIASAMRRSDLAPLGVKALHPVIRNPAGSDATAEEKSVYAACLVKIGIADEALEILAQVEPGDFPDSLLYQSHALVSRWNYEESIRILERYIALPSLTARQQMLGRMNLAAAFVHEGDTRRAELLLKALEKENGAPDRAHFLGNTYELLAQWAVGAKQWKACAGYLSKAQKLLGGARTVDEFFVRKWRAIADILEKGPGLRRDEALLGVYTEAVRRKHWETVRDCDLYRAFATACLPMAVHLYVGTPFETFRKRIFREFPGQLSIPKTYDWQLMRGNRKGPVVACLLEPPADLRPLSLQLLRVLSSDFYRPFRVGELSRVLYQGEYFNPESSPARVHTAVTSLRKWLEKNEIPLDIAEEEGYRFARGSCCALRVPGRWRPERKGPLPRLKERFQSTAFTASQAAEALGEARRSVARWLKDAVEEGALVRTGSGNTTEYRFP